MNFIKKLRLHLIDNIIIGVSFGIGSFMAYMLFD